MKKEYKIQEIITPRKGIRWRPMWIVANDNPFNEWECFFKPWAGVYEFKTEAKARQFITEQARKESQEVETVLREWPIHIDPNAATKSISDNMDADVIQDVTDIEWNSVGVSFSYANRDYACRKNGEVNMRGWQIMLEDLRNVPKIVDALRAQRDD